MQKNVCRSLRLLGSHRSNRQRAFTRIEVCALVAAIGLLALLVAPALASSKTDGERVVCFNNLRMIGRAVNAYKADHADRVSWRTRTTDGGTMPTIGTKPGVAWYELSFLSNVLVTPKILACPADNGVRVARSFPQYTSVGYRESATSYTVALDPEAANPRAWISGDRNLRPSGGFTACSSRINNADTINAFLSSLAWTNAVHGIQGHILLNDGSVLYTETTTMRTVLFTNLVNNNFHFLRAR